MAAQEATPDPKGRCYRWFPYRMLAVLVIAVLCVAAFGAGAYLTRVRRPGAPVLVACERYVGVILPAGTEILGEEGVVWEPNLREIQSAEQRLSTFLAANAPDLQARLGEYVRQYCGVVEGGRRKVYCNFVHRTHFADSDSDGVVEHLRELGDFILVFDGGDHYFQLFYDVEEDSCADLAVNGEA